MIYDDGSGERSVGPGAGEGKRGSNPHPSARGKNQNQLNRLMDFFVQFPMRSYEVEGLEFE